MTASAEKEETHMQTTQREEKRIRLSALHYLPEEPAPLAAGARRLYYARPQVPFEMEGVRVPRELRVVDVTLGDQRYQPRPSDRREHASGADVALAGMEFRQIEAGKTIEVLVEALAASTRSEALVLGRPLEESGLSCVPLLPIERRDQFELEELAEVTIETTPRLRGHAKRIHFRAEGVDELDLVELCVGKDSQRVVPGAVPLRFFPGGLDVSCRLDIWCPLVFKVRNRGGRKTLAMDVDLAPETEA